MSKTIDERIVEMQFDNKQFEDGVQESLGTIDKLKNALKFDDSVKGLEKLQNATDDFNTSGMVTAIETVSSKFSALEVMGITALANLTNSAVNWGKQMAESLTVDQIGSGFDKYERKVKAVQTILNNAEGETIDTVTAQMEKLNWFTDETSYSFADMVDNIGKFTSNQIPLAQAVTSMMGIADAAGLAGVSVSDASHAMDGFSKAIGQGYMSRQNWQWIRTAHMDTAEFKRQLIETAEEVGTLVKVGDDAWETIDGASVSIADFESAMKDGWINTETMIKTLEKFGGTTEEIFKEYERLEGNVTTSDIIENMGIALDDLGLRAFKASQEAKTFGDAIDSVKDAVSTNWMNIFEQIFGNYEEAKVLWTNVANEMWDIFASGGSDLVDTLKDWHNLSQGGYTDMIEALANFYNGIKALLGPIARAWEQIFPPKTAEDIAGFVKGMKGLSERFLEFATGTKKASEPMENLTKWTIKTKEEFENAKKPIDNTTEAIEKLAKAVIYGTYGSGDERRKAIEALGESYEVVQNKVNELLGVDFRYEVEQKEVNKVVEDGTEVTEDYADSLEETTDEEKEQTRLLQNLHDVFQGLFSVIDIFKTLITSAFKAALDLAGKLAKAVAPLAMRFLDLAAAVGRAVTAFSESLKQFNIFERIFSTVGDALAKVLSIVVNWIDTFWETLKNSAGVQRLTKAFQGLFDIVKKFAEDKLNSIIKFIEKFIGSSSDSSSAEKFAGVVEKIADKLGEFIEKVINNEFSIKEFFGLFSGTVVENVTKVANALGQFMHVDGTPLGALLNLWTRATEFIQNTITNPAFSKFEAFKTNVASIWSTIIQQISSMDTEKLASTFKSTSAGVLFAAFAELLHSFAGVGKGASGFFSNINGVLEGVKDVLVGYQQQIRADNIKKIAEAIGVLALSVFALSFVNQENLTNVVAGLSTLGIVLAVIFKVLGNIGGGSSALKIDLVNQIASPLNKFLDGIKSAFSKAARLVSFALAAIGFASALLIFANVLNKVKDYDWEKLQSSMWVMAGTIAYLGLVIGLMNRLGGNGGTIGGSLALLAMAKAIDMLAVTLDKFQVFAAKKGSIDAVMEVVAMITALGFAVMMGTANSGHYITFALSLIIIANALGTFAEKAQAFADVKWDTLGKAGTALLAMSVGLIAMSKLSKDSVSLITIAGALGILTGALYVLSQISWDGLTNGLKALGIALVALIAAAALSSIEFISKGLNNLADAALNIGVAFAAVGVGALAFGAALVLITTYMQNIVDGLIILGTAIEEHGKELAIAMAAIIGVLIATVASVTIARSAEIKNIIVAVMGIVADAFTGSLPKLLMTLGTGILVILAFLSSIAPDVVDKVVDLVINLFDNLARAIETNAPKIAAAILRMGKAILDVIVEVLAQILNALTGPLNLGDRMKDALAKMGDSYNEYMADLAEQFDANAEKTGDAIPNGFERSFKKAEPRVKKSAFRIKKAAEEGLADDGTAEKTGEDTIDKYEMGITKGGTDLNSIISNLKESGLEGLIDKDKLAEAAANGTIDDYLSQFLDRQNEAQADGEALSGAAYDGVAENTEEIGKEGDKAASSYTSMYAARQADAKRKAEALGNSAYEGVKSTTWKISGEGSTAASKYTSMFAARQAEARSNAEALGNSAADGVASTNWRFSAEGESSANVYGYAMKNSSAPADGGSTMAHKAADAANRSDLMYNSGTNMVYGYVQGINDHVYLVHNAADSVAHVVDGSVKYYNVIQSPSKLMYENGTYIVQGFVNGIKEHLGLVTKVADNMAHEPENQLTGVAAAIADMLGQDFDDSLTIRPVLDLTEVRSGASQISSMLANQQANLIAQSATNASQTEMGLLIDLVSRIYNSVQNGSDLYLDDGILAGRINRRLGQL